MILTRCQDVTLRSSWWPWRICKEARNVYCLAMALYCPLPGQFLAIARQETTRREEEGEATRRRSNKKEKEEEGEKKTTLAFTLHSSPNRLKPL